MIHLELESQGKVRENDFCKVVGTMVFVLLLSSPPPSLSSSLVIVDLDVSPLLLTVVSDESTM